MGIPLVLCDPNRGKLLTAFARIAPAVLTRFPQWRRRAPAPRHLPSYLPVRVDAGEAARGKPDGAGSCRRVRGCRRVEPGIAAFPPSAFRLLPSAFRRRSSAACYAGRRQEVSHRCVPSFALRACGVCWQRVSSRPSRSPDRPRPLNPRRTSRPRAPEASRCQTRIRFRAPIRGVPAPPARDSQRHDHDGGRADDPNGSVLLRDGKIAAVGASVDAPADAHGDRRDGQVRHARHHRRAFAHRRLRRARRAPRSATATKRPIR